MRHHFMTLCVSVSLCLVGPAALLAQNPLVPVNRDGNLGQIQSPSVEERLARLEGELRALTNFLGLHLVARTDGQGLIVVPETTGRILRIEDALRDLKRDPQPASPRTGLFIVDNHRGTYQVMNVNGILHNVPPGRLAIQVPYSPVTAYLFHFETPKVWNNWQWNGQDYQIVSVIH